MGKEKLSVYSMSPAVRKRIEKEGLYALATGTVRTKSKVALIIGLVLLVVAVAVYLLNVAVDDLYYILGVIGILFTLYGALSILSTKATVKARTEGLQFVEYYYGKKAEDVLKEIDKQVSSYQGKIPATESRGYFTKDWYIAPGFTRFVQLTDIACVVGIMGKGTFVIPTHGEPIDEMFGGNPNWGKLFAIIENANPHVLSHEDLIYLDGKHVKIFDVMDDVTVILRTGKKAEKRKDALNAIVTEFIGRVESAQAEKVQTNQE